MFIKINTPILLSRFSLSFQYAFNCADYYVTNIRTGRCISKDILFTLDRLESRIVVSRFCPEISRQVNSKYLSATCFFLMVHHFRRLNRLSSDYDIYLTATPAVFRRFYEKLNDFHFHIQGPKTDQYWQATSDMDRTRVDTAMITRYSENGSLPVQPSTPRD